MPKYETTLLHIIDAVVNKKENITVQNKASIKSKSVAANDLLQKIIIKYLAGQKWNKKDSSQLALITPEVAPSEGGGNLEIDNILIEFNALIFAHLSKRFLKKQFNQNKAILTLEIITDLPGRKSGNFGSIFFQSNAIQIEVTLNKGEIIFFNSIKKIKDSNKKVYKYQKNSQDTLAVFKSRVLTEVKINQHAFEKHKVRQITITENEMCFSMPRVNGTELNKLDSLQLGNFGPRNDALNFLIYNLINAVASFHETKRTHKDIKPQNILVDETLKATLIDFGLTEKSGAPFGNCGTLQYIPLQNTALESNLSHDCYSLGLTLAELILGFQRSKEQFHNIRQQRYGALSEWKDLNLRQKIDVIKRYQDWIWHEIYAIDVVSRDRIINKTIKNIVLDLMHPQPSVRITAVKAREKFKKDLPMVERNHAYSKQHTAIVPTSKKSSIVQTQSHTLKKAAISLACLAGGSIGLTAIIIASIMGCQLLIAAGIFSMSLWGAAAITSTSIAAVSVISGSLIATGSHFLKNKTPEKKIEQPPEPQYDMVFDEGHALGIS